MASLEMKIISKMLHTKSMDEAIRCGLKESFFKDADALLVYKYLEGYYNATNTKKQFPLLEEIKRRFPIFELLPEHGLADMPQLVGHLKGLAMSSEVLTLARSFEELAEQNEEEALSFITGELPNIIRRYRGGKGFGTLEITEFVKKAYQGAKDGSTWGVPWPWDVLTRDTMGKNKGDFVVFYGRMKSMKTWLMYHCAITDYRKYNQRVMIWSREMDPRKTQLRLGSLLAKVDYQLLKKGALPKHLYKRAMDELDALDATARLSKDEIKTRGNRNYADLIVLCGPDAPRGMDELQANVQIYQPDVLYLDSFYHLESKRAGNTSQQWAKIQYVAEDIKSLALDMNIPIIGAAQANRLGEKLLGENLTEMAGSDAIAREADLLIRVVKQKKGHVLKEHDYEGRGRVEVPPLNRSIKVSQDMRAVAGIPSKVDLEPPPARTGAKIAMILPGNREGVLDAFTIFAIPGYNFEVDQESFPSDTVEKWMKEDTAAAQQEINEVVNKNKIPKTKKGGRKYGGRHDEPEPIPQAFVPPKRPK